ncbi:protein root UVB sensitive 4 isoform X2 [Salvia hispanica]|uniref:protein root UVB sensitive 4 isoform X2 n=1 Tax=Salvia hispanica TaxID=49212 RepID=UPI002009B539|nr:protein root UVB sensitive 4 isoform X2 [Salvia hispanica]
MNLTLHAHTNSPLYCTRYDPIRPAKPIDPKTSLKPLAVSKPSSIPFKFNHEYQDEQKIKPLHFAQESPKKFDLPVVVHRSGTILRYFWDGNEMQLVSVGGVTQFSIWNFSSLGRVCGVAIRNFFLPREVNENYMEYVKWKFLHRVFSSALQVLATQAMFRAIGMGYSRSLPSAAALNWVLKDGLGRLSRCIYTASLASDFDTNLKRVRFSTSILFSLSIGVELLTPAYPAHFLLLATIANIAKQISLACYLSTGTAVHRSFAISDNLGEVSAKSQIQTVCFDNVGLLLAATFNILFRNNQRLLAVLPFVVYPIFSTIDLFGIYQSLKHVHLQTLTKDRLELIIKIWIQHKYIPSPAEVSEREGINIISSKGRELLPIRVGCLNHKRKIPRLSLMTLRSLKDKDFYFVCLENHSRGSRLKDHGILLSMREGAQTTDMITGLLQACYIREGLLVDMAEWENVLEACDLSDSACEWLTLIRQSKKRAEADVSEMVEKMSRLGWVCRNVLLSAREQVEAP